MEWADSIDLKGVHLAAASFSGPLGDVDNYVIVKHY